MSILSSAVGGGVKGMKMVLRSKAAAVLSRGIPGVGAVSTALTVGSMFGGGHRSQGKLPTFTGSGPGLDLGDVTRFFGGKGKSRVGMDGNGKCPQGYHPCKDKRGCCRNRHVNYANGRAIARSVRRVRGAEKMFRKVFTISHKQAPGKILPKRRGR